MPDQLQPVRAAVRPTNRIRLLSEQVANQIAAGEVVERPASVVKELVENALDAGSRRISVEIQAGGRSLIRVTDDGTGMSRDDALLCLERHATSKIQHAEDLAAIRTMGFRGEALPSIASVSRMSITTRESSAAGGEATQVVIHGGKIVEVRAAGSPIGTCAEVRQLFFNLPARRKFLRSDETEFGHIQHYLTLIALAHPELAFQFVKDGRPVWQLPAIQFANDASGRLQACLERYQALHGSGDPLLPVDFSKSLWEAGPRESEDSAEPAAPAPVLRVWGYIGKPGVSRSTRQDQHLFVNRRPVENRGLNFALMEGYHTALMKGRYPVCTLFLEIDPAEVDVNIHPSKREVKFHHERAVRQAATEAVRQSLLAYHAQPPGDASQRTATPPRLEPSPGFVSVLPVHSNKPFSPPAPAPAQPEPIPTAAAESRPASAEVPRAWKPMYFPASLPTSASQPSLASPTEEEETAVMLNPRPLASSSLSGTAEMKAGGEVPLLMVPLRLLGVVGRLYVVFESDRGLVLVDQHAAHERILFEQMLNRLESQGEAPSQRLLLPETVELSVRDAQFLRNQLETLRRMGVELSEFGERTFLLEALPPFAKATDPRRFVLELLDELKAAGQQVNTLRLGEHTIAKTVCRHAVKANDFLSGRELENLVDDLRLCAMPYTCPHGRPTLIEMSYRELEKKFGRLQ